MTSVAATISTAASSASTAIPGGNAGDVRVGHKCGWDACADKQGRYDPKGEKDECGVGAICDFYRRTSRQIVLDAQDMLVRMAHRGAETRPGDGDGAGLLCSIPDEFLRKRVKFLDGVAPGEYRVCRTWTKVVP